MSRKVEIHTYLCTNSGCRNVEKESGLKKGSIKCSCGSNMRHLKTEKE